MYLKWHFLKDQSKAAILRRRVKQPIPNYNLL